MDLRHRQCKANQITEKSTQSTHKDKHILRVLGWSHSLWAIDLHYKYTQCRGRIDCNCEKTCACAGRPLSFSNGWWWDKGFPPDGEKVAHYLWTKYLCNHSRSWSEDVYVHRLCHIFNLNVVIQIFAFTLCHSSWMFKIMHLYDNKWRKNKQINAQMSSSAPWFSSHGQLSWPYKSS